MAGNNAGIVLSVSQLNAYINAAMRDDPMLRAVSVRGEISNFHKHSSGHLYFSLKDESSVIRCVMFKQNAASVRFKPEGGMSVIAEGYISLYARDGQLQIYCERLKRDGIGDLYLKFEELKLRLAQEGLFDAARKRPLPALPRAVGVVTSPTGAAVRDILRVSLRRHPGMRVVIAPAKVQGDGAAEEIARGIEALSKLEDIGVIICGRGGGSIEDLWAFNEEIVARAIAQSPVPVISAVGHETDFTIADFAADVRAATPSNAAELAVPEYAQMIERRERNIYRMQNAINRQLRMAQERLYRAANSAVLKNPGAVITPKQERLLRLETALCNAAVRRVKTECANVRALKRNLTALSPRAVLERGYSIILNAQGKAVRSVSCVLPGESFRAMLRDGEFTARREE